MTTRDGGIVDRVAEHLIALTIRCIHPSRRQWGEALAAEARQLESDWARLRWAVNGLPLAWTLRHAANHEGESSMHIRTTLAAINQRGADPWSVGVTFGLVGLVVFSSVTVVPSVVQFATHYGVALPLPMRMVIGASRNSVAVTVMLVALIALLWRRGRHSGETLPLRRLLVTTNVACVLTLAALTTGVVASMLTTNRMLGDAQRERDERAAQDRNLRRVERLRASNAFEVPESRKR